MKSTLQKKDGKSVISKATGGETNKGGAATASADELAAELSNPNTAVATLNFKNQFRWFSGDLPDADNQSNYTLLFQPVLPFVLDSGAKVIWRPALENFSGVELLRGKGGRLWTGVDAGSECFASG